MKFCGLSVPQHCRRESFDHWSVGNSIWISNYKLQLFILPKKKKRSKYTIFQKIIDVSSTTNPLNTQCPFWHECTFYVLRRMDFLKVYHWFLDSINIKHYSPLPIAMSHWRHSIEQHLGGGAWVKCIIFDFDCIPTLTITTTMYQCPSTAVSISCIFMCWFK